MNTKEKIYYLETINEEKEIRWSKLVLWLKEAQKEIEHLELELSETEKCWKNNEKALNEENTKLKKELTIIKQKAKEVLLKWRDESCSLSNIEEEINELSELVN